VSLAFDLAALNEYFDKQDREKSLCDRIARDFVTITELRAENERLRKVVEAAKRFHHRYCDGADEHEQAVRWRELDAALAALDGKEKA